LEARGLACVVGVASDFGVHLPEEVAAAAQRPLPVKKKAGRPRHHAPPAQQARLCRAAEVVAAQPEAAWPTITWRRGSDGPLTKPFVALGVDRAVGERPLPGHAGEKTW